MRVRITATSKATYWYASQIGEVFEVTPKAVEQYRVNDDPYALIHACDCEVLDTSELLAVCQRILERDTLVGSRQRLRKALEQLGGERASYPKGLEDSRYLYIGQNDCEVVGE